MELTSLDGSGEWAEPAAGLGDRHRSLESLVADELRRRIVTGQLTPGTRLVAAAIGDELSVSRGPVRSAIQKLASEGLVMVMPRRGACVATVTVTEALDCYDVRAALEGVAASRAAENATPAQLSAIAATIADGRRAVELERWHDLAALNYQLHEQIALASHNGELLMLMRQYALRISWIFSQSARQRSHAAWDEHEGIIEAIRAGDAAAAERRAREHIAVSRAKFLEIASDRIHQ